MNCKHSTQFNDISGSSYARLIYFHHASNRNGFLTEKLDRIKDGMCRNNLQFAIKSRELNGEFRLCNKRVLIAAPVVDVKAATGHVQKVVGSSNTYA